MKKEIRAVKNIIKKHRLISKRVEELRKKGFNVQEKSMGPGGVGQVKFLAGETRVQVSYGHGKHNYATVVVLKNQTL